MGVAEGDWVEGALGEERLEGHGGGDALDEAGGGVEGGEGGAQVGERGVGSGPEGVHLGRSVKEERIGEGGAQMRDSRASRPIRA